MSKKRTTYSADFLTESHHFMTASLDKKAKLVLEVLDGTKTLNEIASKYELLPKNLLNWKKQFINNASLTFDKSTVVKEYLVL
jgi:putative transposase